MSTNDPTNASERVPITGAAGFLGSHLCDRFVRDGFQVVAMDNLINGQSVVGDSVNPIELTRKDWRDVAECAGCAFIELEVVCTDKDERRVRLLGREAGNLGRVERLMNREFEAWTSAIPTIDTAGVELETSLAEVLALVK